MKLLFCKSCGDLQKMTYRLRTCECGAASGRYLSCGDEVEIAGPAVVLGISNEKLSQAVRCQSSTYTMPFDAWVFQDTYRKVHRTATLSEMVESAVGRIAQQVERIPPVRKPIALPQPAETAPFPPLTILNTAIPEDEFWLIAPPVDGQLTGARYKEGVGVTALNLPLYSCMTLPMVNDGKTGR